jgi:hypothetical protein
MSNRIAVIAGLVAAVAVTLADGLPRTMPEVALGSVELFHLERAIALLAGYVAIVLLVSRAWSGQLPSELSPQGLKYSEGLSEAALAWQDAAKELETARAERADLLKRVEALEGRGVR